MREFASNLKKFDTELLLEHKEAAGICKDLIEVSLL